MSAIIPAPDQPVPRWHISPLIDLSAYAFSWAWVLIPMLLLGPKRTDYLLFFLVILGLNFAHRHLTMPYVYGDAQVFKRHPLKFTVLPLAMLALFIATPWIHRHYRGVFTACAGVAVLWNIWHVYMQKYGILRMYNAKSGIDPPLRAPGWADRLLILGWIPLYFAWLGPHHRELVARYFRTGRAYSLPTLDWLTANQFWLLPLTIAIAASGVIAFLRYEWRASRWRNSARMLNAAGTTALSIAFLIFDPVKVYLAFAFSHAVEYCTFVWAYQRKRYHQPLAHRPLLGRWLKHPWIFYTLVIGGCAALYLILKFWGWYIQPEAERIHLFGIRGGRWIFWWAVYQSMVHFYFDGFLWKMRLPTVRAHL